MSSPQDLIAGRYRLIHRVGRGGMGVVWEAWDERLHRRVAAKQLQLPPGPSDVEAELASQRAMREARISARLHHPHAVQVFDVVDDDGRPCLIMQFLPSITLAEVLREMGPLQADEAAQVGAEVASALSAAHELGIVHRDIKPGNILIADDGNALISDFGISHAFGDVTLTEKGLVHGTPAYLSPEAARGEESSFASDVFSLGGTLYAALEGSPPFGADQNPIALLYRIASGTFEPPRQGGPLTPLLVHMLSAEPSARPSMRAVATSLAQLVSSAKGGHATRAGVPTRRPAAPTTAAAGGTSREANATTAAAGTPNATGATTQAAWTPNKTTAAPPARGQSQTHIVAETAPVGSAPERPVAARAGSSSSSIKESASAKSPERRRWTGRWGVALAALVAVGTLIAFLVSALSGPGTGTVGQPGTSTTTSPPTSSARQETTSSASSDTTKQATSPASSPVPNTPSPPPTSALPKRTRSPGVGSPTEGQLIGAITSYYALMPANTSQAWPRMTASYQTNHAGGRRAYERFWGAIGRVTVRNVTASPPRRAQATLVYYYKNGRVVTEQTSYQLVEESGTLKISDSTVLGSSSR